MVESKIPSCWVSTGEISSSIGETCLSTGCLTGIREPSLPDLFPDPFLVLKPLPYLDESAADTSLVRCLPLDDFLFDFCLGGDGFILYIILKSGVAGV